MLEDRSYMRRPPLALRQSAVTWVVVANVAAFLLQCFLYGYPLRLRTDDPFALSIDGLRHGYVWQLLTFQFMHGGLLHLLFNCLAIFMFGRSLEEVLGRKGFLSLYFAGGIIGGLSQALAGALFGGVFGLPVVGASAGAFALVAAFAMFYPDRPITVLLVVIPITMRARTLLIASAALAVVLILFPAGNMANAAHLGGMLTGILFVHFAVRWRWQWPRSRKHVARPQLVKVRSQKAAPWGDSAPVTAEELSSAEFFSKEVDPILEKISAHGIQSLSERERKILEDARQRMGRKR
jgi:membrane associated rhomboid family serine protease